MFPSFPMRLDLRLVSEEQPAMESKEVGGKRSSGIMSLINTETPSKSVSSMPSPAILSPHSIYLSGPPPPYSGWSAPGLHTASGLISPPDSRRTSDGRTEPPLLQIQTAPMQRQTLPSIHEALSSNGTCSRTSSYPSPIPVSQPSSHPSTHHQAIYAQTQPSLGSRAHASFEHQSFPIQPPSSQPHHSSPLQPLPPTSFPRHDGLSEHTRRPPMSSLQNAPASPPDPYASRYERFEQDRRASDMASNGHGLQPSQSSYVHASHPNQQHPPIRGPMFSYPNYQAQGHEPVEGWKSQKSGPYEFQDHVNRSLDAYDFENCLIHIKESSAALLEISTHYYKVAQEQQRPARDGMPNRLQCMQMLDRQAVIYKHLSLMRDLIDREDAIAADQRMREVGSKIGAGDYDEEMSMYSDEMKQGSNGGDAKRRKGRAAPPGRCHSCNRAETPEWRRGPDGARTLCNACGLHYAKLTRKNHMKAQNAAGSPLQPKAMDHHSPPPL